MKRFLFNLLAGMSLVLCVVTAGLWITSYKAFASVDGDLKKISGNGNWRNLVWIRERVSAYYV